TKLSRLKKDRLRRENRITRPTATTSRPTRPDASPGALVARDRPVGGGVSGLVAAAACCDCRVHSPVVLKTARRTGATGRQSRCYLASDDHGKFRYWSRVS